ncbi:MAG TPA: hypothetical protein VGG30_00845 [Pirellulales bacterium]
MKRWVGAIGIAVGCLLAAGASAAEETIDTIDTYGLGKLSRETVLEAAGLHAGDRLPRVEEFDGIERKLKAIPGVEDADVSVVHVARQRSPPGSMEPTVYVGIREAGRPGVSFRAAPTSDVTLPDEVVDAYRRFEAAWMNSIRYDRRGEDDSNGYALFGDDATREIQKQFVPLAERHFDRLADVLRTAKNTDRRAAAAWVIAYASDKTKAAAELDAAVRDPNPQVRNNAMRGLAVILGYAAKHPELKIDAPIDSYFDLLESVEWTDRNKAMAVLGELSADGNEPVLTKLRTRSLPALVEMARWQTEGHAMMALMLVGRIAGLTGDEVIEACKAGKREEVIAWATAAAKGE